MLKHVFSISLVIFSLIYFLLLNFRENYALDLVGPKIWPSVHVTWPFKPKTHQKAKNWEKKGYYPSIFPNKVFVDYEK